MYMYTVLYMGDAIDEILFALLHTSSLQKRGLPEKKDITPLAAISFLLEWFPFPRGQL